MNDIHLVLFLTEGTRLQDWHATGLLSREAELYRRIRPQVGSITWVSYGGQADLQFQSYLPDIAIAVNKWRLPNAVYIQQLPWLHPEVFHRATILKAEQTGAARAALTVAKYYGKRFIARSGFSLALFVQYDPAAYQARYDDILALERQTFQQAQKIVVTTEEMRQTAIQTHQLPDDKINVIPNYVNTERFAPATELPQQARIVFIGRFTHQKNLGNLLEAVRPLTDVPVDIIGSGEQIPPDVPPHVNLVGNIANDQLPDYLHRATLYVQPSRYEGHPKTIFEAMACGLPVVVGDAPGIRQFITHGETGWLVDPEDPAAIRAGLLHLLENEELRRAMGLAARNYVVEHLSLERVVAQEWVLLQAVQQMPALEPQPTARPILKSVWTYIQRVLRLVQRRLSNPLP